MIPGRVIGCAICHTRNDPHNRHAQAPARRSARAGAPRSVHAAGHGAGCDRGRRGVHGGLRSRRRRGATRAPVRRVRLLFARRRVAADERHRPRATVGRCVERRRRSPRAWSGRPRCLRSPVGGNRCFNARSRVDWSGVSAASCRHSRAASCGDRLWRMRRASWNSGDRYRRFVSCPASTPRCGSSHRLIDPTATRPATTLLVIPSVAAGRMTRSGKREPREREPEHGERNPVAGQRHRGHERNKQRQRRRQQRRQTPARCRRDDEPRASPTTPRGTSTPYVGKVASTGLRSRA